MLRDFGKRAIVTAISLFIVGFLIVFALTDWGQYLVALFTSLLTVVAIWEYERFAKAKGGKIILPAVIAFGFLEVLSFFIAAQGPNWAVLPIATFFVGFLVLFALSFREKEGALVNLSTSFFGLLYIAIPMGMVLGILYGEDWDGRWWVAYLLIVIKITDIGAYFGGSLWGRHKLAPMISPRKTIEGALFGLGCALFSSFALHRLSQAMGASDFQLSTKEWIILGLILGTIAQFSDLAESLLKRDARKKDSNALPGIGGVLDAIDSLLFTVPIFYLYLNFIRL